MIALLGALLLAVAATVANARSHPSSRTARAATAGCHSYRRALGAVARSRWRGVRFTRVVNSFGSGMFGVAAGGALQSERRRAVRNELSADMTAGARWIRIDINWAEIQDRGRDHYRWRAIDRVVRRAAACGLNVLGTILYTPRWARPEGTSSSYAPSARSYAAFAAVAARHYAALGVHVFEVWNEPNTSAAWRPRPDASAYTALLKAAYVSIKRTDPWATVLTGGTAPAGDTSTSYSPVSFLRAIYANGGGGYFDAVAQHPYCWPAFPGARREWSAWYQMYGAGQSLRSVMLANGDGAKKIWATEFGAPTGGPSGTHVSRRAQARMVMRAYRLWAGYSWAGPLFFFQGRDQGNDRSTFEDFFGFVTHDFAPKPAYLAYRAASAAVARSLAG